MTYQWASCYEAGKSDPWFHDNVGEIFKLHRYEYETWQNFIEDVNIEEFVNKEVLILEIENRPACRLG